MPKLKPRLQASWIDKLPERVRNTVQDSMSTLRLSKGEVVFSAGEIPKGIYQVCAGKIKMTSSTHSGKELVLLVCPPPLTFGETSLISGIRSMFSAVAIEETRLSLIKKNNFDALREQHPEINHLLLKNVCTRQMWNYRVLEGSATLDLRTRLAGRLVLLSHTIGEPLEEYEVMLSIRQEDLANMLGSTRQSINLLLHEWESDGFLNIVYGGLKITNLAALSSIYFSETFQ